MRPGTAVYTYIDYPSPEKEMEIVKTQVPSAPSKLIEEVVKVIQEIRRLDIMKKPSIRATVDWVKTLITLGKDRLDRKTFEDTIGVLFKNQHDKEKMKSFDFRR